MLVSDPGQIQIENHRIPQTILYQQNAQPNQQTIQATDGQIHYIVQEDDLPNDNYNIAQQPKQVFYQQITTENGQQIIHHGKRNTTQRKHNIATVINFSSFF